MKGIKLILLILALALPVLIFVFLKFFGKNEFNVEPLFAEGPPAVSGCPESPPSQYYLLTELLTGSGWSTADSLTLIMVGIDRQRNTFEERLRGDFTATEIKIAYISGVTADSLQQLRTCYFFMNEPYNLLLVDKQRRIRGIYQAENREEIDRLLVEARIILKKY
ncbi:MAG: hypothetical protein KF803_18095 [Cyclobacteriaceae bacterium]|nr:hypothetical protein [Cyclobacteriaceae bacterium]